MSSFTIEYSTDGQQSWTLVDANYSGSVSIGTMNEFLSDLGLTKAYFKTYISGSDTGSTISFTQTYLIGGMQLGFTSYYSVSEHKYMCVVNRGEFNKTSNPTLYDESGSERVSITQEDTDGNDIITTRDENFHTFTTGIGLYDDSLQLVAYAKFANPIKIERDFDSVFIVKFDI